jgi:SAM-dependent methyltransferase
MIEQMTDRRCPICDSAKNSELRQVSRREVLSHVAKCGRCGFVFVTDPPIDTADDDELAADFEPGDRARYRHSVRLIAELFPDRRPFVVEIGAGFGQLGERLQTTADYVGFEPALNLSEFAQRSGVRIIAQMFDPSLLDRPPDVVVLDNVIEHVLDPVGLLRDSASSLTPGGHLVIIVPNRNDVRQLIPSWRDKNHWIPPDHINYFTARGLRRVLRSLDLEPHPFGFRAIEPRKDWRYLPRALSEMVAVYPFGLNIYASKHRGG